MRYRLLATFLLTIFAASAWAANNDLGLLGFKPDRVDAQRQLEEKFASYLSKDNVRDWDSAYVGQAPSCWLPVRKRSSGVYPGQILELGV